MSAPHKLGGLNRPSGGGLRRFVSLAVTEPTSLARANLRIDHEAVVNARTLFPSRVFEPAQRDRVLISGFNNSKIGRLVTKGPWRGMPIYLLSLEERATCPRSCAVWRACYGNGMPMAVRFRYSPKLMMSLEAELEELDSIHPDGFVVRPHVLGDFPDLDYLRHWAEWSDRFETLHIWGYTAHPASSAIGRKIAMANRVRPERWQIRFSVAPGVAHAPMQASAIWFRPEPGLIPNGMIVCPQELGKTATCGTCALCWNPNAAGLRILFLGHGSHSSAKSAKPLNPPIAAKWRPPPVPRDPALEALAIDAYVAANGVTR